MARTQEHVQSARVCYTSLTRLMRSHASARCPRASWPVRLPARAGGCELRNQATVNEGNTIILLAQGPTVQTIAGIAGLGPAVRSSSPAEPWLPKAASIPMDTVNQPMQSRMRGSRPAVLSAGSPLSPSVSNVSVPGYDSLPGQLLLGQYRLQCAGSLRNDSCRLPGTLASLVAACEAHPGCQVRLSGTARALLWYCSAAAHGTAGMHAC